MNSKTHTENRDDIKSVGMKIARESAQRNMRSDISSKKAFDYYSHRNDRKR